MDQSIVYVVQRKASGEQQIMMIEILFDELADPSEQEIIFFYGDIK